MKKITDKEGLNDPIQQFDEIVSIIKQSHSSMIYAANTALIESPY